MPDEEKPRTAAIIVAAGRGARMGQADGPKQYQRLGARPMLGKTLNAFLKCETVDLVQVVIHADDMDLYQRAAGRHDKLLPPVIGAATRQGSVLCGLEALEGVNPGRVLIHDAARPLVSVALIETVTNAISDVAGCVPAIAVVDTLKRVGEDGTITANVPRDGLYGAQTPQGFPYRKILAAHQSAARSGRDDFTDDGAIAEWAGLPVSVVEGSPDNGKITTQADLERVRNMLSIPDIRSGHGYDTHQLVAGQSIWLCGVEIPHDRTLSGHSDADVGLHALTDALLGAIADGDIGSHFPPSDPQWRGARSDQFLRHAHDRVCGAGGTITHCDVTLICERPKIGPHRDAMREAIADMLGISVDRISVKATTNERIGFVGREEGIAALATATIVMGEKS